MRERLFSFTSDALPPGTFEVVEFTGTEGLSQLYEFDILIVSDNLDIPLENVIREMAHLTIHRHEAKNAVFHGLPVEFEQLHAVNNVGFYRVRLVPRLWRLSLIRNNQVILDKPLVGFLTDILNDGGLSSLDFEFRLQGQYYPRQYICQYAETHLDFISRWLEREGIYYFFEQGEDREKIIFTNTAIAHTEHPFGRTLQYHPVSGLAGSHGDEVIANFTCRQKLSPGGIFVKEYNDMKPTLNVTGSAPVSESGFGQVYYYHENFRIPEEGEHLAKIRAQAIACREKVFHGDSFVPYLAPGYTFDLTGHFRSDYNRSFHTIDVRHEGNQTGFLTAGLKAALSDRESTAFYRNGFSAISSDVQFRAERVTPWPKISGTISAHIDASGTGKYAELDAFGRYRVLLPFDLAGHPEGKASAWVRMAQPYAGEKHGMHFPLHKGTEVLLTFIDGNPDRPIIAAAVPNSQTMSMVTKGNARMAGFATAGGSSLHADDTEGKEGLFLNLGGEGSPAGTSFTRGSDSAKVEWCTANLNLANGVVQTAAAGIGTFWKLFRSNTYTGFPVWQVMADLYLDVVLGRAVPLCTAAYQTKLSKEQGEIQQDEAKMIADLGTYLFSTDPDKKKAAVADFSTQATNLQNAQSDFQDTTRDVNVLQKVQMGTTAMMLVLNIASNILMGYLLGKVIESKVPVGTANRWREILSNSSYRVSSTSSPFGPGVAVQQGLGMAGQAMSFICNTGPLMTYSKNDTHIVSNEDVTISAMGQRGGKGVTIDAMDGSVDISTGKSGSYAAISHITPLPVGDLINSRVEVTNDQANIVHNNGTGQEMSSATFKEFLAKIVHNDEAGQEVSSLTCDNAGAKIQAATETENHCCEATLEYVALSSSNAESIGLVQAAPDSVKIIVGESGIEVSDTGIKISTTGAFTVNKAFDIDADGTVSIN